MNWIALCLNLPVVIKIFMSKFLCKSPTPVLNLNVEDRSKLCNPYSGTRDMTYVALKTLLP